MGSLTLETKLTTNGLHVQKTQGPPTCSSGSLRFAASASARVGEFVRQAMTCFETDRNAA
jgi:hypothetical protein